MTKKPNYDKKYYKFTFEDENHRGFTYSQGDRKYRELDGHEIYEKFCRN